MGNIDNSEAFLRAFETADCETLQGQIRDWFERPYRTPENTIDIAAIVHSAMTAALTAREDECRAKWRMAEADRWKQARQSFDAGMRGFLEAIGRQPKSEPYEGEARERTIPAIGAGWRIPKVERARRGRPPGKKSGEGWGQPQHA